METVGTGSQFSQELTAALRRRFGRIPSAAFVATQFNRLAGDQKRISSETARRWLRGSSMPEYRHLEVLIEWLDIDVTKIFKNSKSANQAQSDSKPPMDLERSKEFAKNLAGLRPEQRDVLISMLKLLPSISRDLFSPDHLLEAQMDSGGGGQMQVAI